MKPQEREDLLRSLKRRFEKHAQRHKGIAWAEVQPRLDGDVGALESLRQMEGTGGEPDVIGQDKATGLYTFCDCAAESPSGRRSLCYDKEALDARKENKPQGSALGMAAAMGIQLLTEEQYRALQRLGEFDTKTSSWVSPAGRALARWRSVLRPSLWPGVRVPQRCAVVLRFQGFPRLAAGVKAVRRGCHPGQPNHRSRSCPL